MRSILILFSIASIGAIASIGVFAVPAKSAELTARERKMVETVNATVRRAGVGYSSGKHDEAAQSIRRAMDQIGIAMRTGNPDLYDALVPAIKRISKAHAMLEIEGVSLPPFRVPDRPEEKQSDGDSEMKPGDEPRPGPDSPSQGISFTKQVAPILVGKCGRCHIQGNRGGFSAASFAALMKGPPEGVVIFAGDPVGSRLIETIETGDMPRGGAKVSPAELTLLKTWVTQGAKFDGPDPSAPISGAAPMPAQNQPRPEIKKATGNETVSFASDVAPLLIENCNGCHIDAMRTQGGLRMDTFAQLLRGGDSGPVITPGRGEDSLLVKKLRGTATDGARMPAGGRPALSDESIQLISKWIDEGAALDGVETQPIKVMSQLAWASKASSAEMTARRGELAEKNLRLVAASTAPQIEETEHFRVIGTGSSATLKAVALEAEKNMKTVKGFVRGPAGEDFFHGKASIFVLPKRYDYSEFSKMVESRSVPSEWTSHWSTDGIDAYVALVATDRDEEDQISQRLLGPLVSLAIATRGGDVPRWFAEGIGTAVAAKGRSTSRAEKQRIQTETVQAIGVLKDAKSFLNGKLTPEQTDRIGAAVGSTMLDRSRRKLFDACLRALSAGQPFEQAFTSAFGGPPAVYIENFRKYAQ